MKTNEFKLAGKMGGACFGELVYSALSMSEKMCCTFLALLFFCGLSSPLSGVEPVVDHLTYLDPKIDNPRIQRQFSPKLKVLWKLALARPDAELRRLAADSITQAALLGLEDFSDTAEPLVSLLKSDGGPMVRRAAARALVTIEAKKTADALLNAASQDGLLMAQIVEPALAKWGPDTVSDKTLSDQWLARISQPSVEPAFRRLAMDHMVTLKDARSVAPMLELVMDENGLPEVRTTAAKSAGQIVESGLTSPATELMARTTHPLWLGPLLATLLLSRHSDDDSISRLHQLARHAEPAVSTAAIRRLHQIGLQHSLEHAPQAIASADVGLRRLGAQILVDRAHPDSIVSLAPLMSDRNPSLRRFVAHWFVEFAAKEEFKRVVIEQTEKTLGSQDWRALEQASLIVGALDHEPSAGRLLELLPHARGEVAIASAWALRKLQLKEVLPALWAYTQSIDPLVKNAPGPIPQAEQIGQLFQAFGDQRFLEAEALLRTYVPKAPIHNHARCSAIWALGYFYEGIDEPKLAAQFAERLADIQALIPETEPVRRLSAVSLGRMKAKSQLRELDVFLKAEGTKTAVGFACGWAVEQITGEKAPAPETSIFSVLGWFLEPTQ